MRITLVVSLVMEEELKRDTRLKEGHAGYREELRRKEIALETFAIKDKSVPCGFSGIQAFVQRLATALRGGARVVVHCNGGKGRSSMVCAATLMMLDPTLSVSKAIRSIQVQRPGALKNPAQHIYLHVWARLHRAPLKEAESSPAGEQQVLLERPPADVPEPLASESTAVGSMEAAAGLGLEQPGGPAGDEAQLKGCDSKLQEVLFSEEQSSRSMGTLVAEVLKAKQEQSSRSIEMFPTEMVRQRELQVHDTGMEEGVDAAGPSCWLGLGGCCEASSSCRKTMCKGV